MPRDKHHLSSGGLAMNVSRSDERQRAALVSRRRLLQAGGIGTLAMGLPGTVAASVNGNRGLGGGAAEKSVIFLLLCGGPSHLDTWDLKPAAPAEIRGPYQPIATSVPGMRISELHHRLAGLTDRFSLIRSMTHIGNISNHFDAMHHCLSGQDGCARRLSVHRFHPGKSPTQPAQRLALRLADQVRRRSGVSAPRISAPGAIWA